MHETRRHDDDVAPAQQRVRRRVPQSLDLGVDRRVLLDEGVGLRHVGLGLVVVVVRDEVLDRVVRHELAELGGELRGERLVVREHERGPLHLLDEPRGGRRLARAGGAEEHDVGLAGVDAAGELRDRGGLVAARPVLAHDLERTDGSRGLHAFQSRFARRHSGGVDVGTRRYARARSCLMRCQRASTWLMVWAIEPSVSMTTSATASRSVLSTWASTRACAWSGRGRAPRRGARPACASARSSPR